MKMEIPRKYQQNETTVEKKPLDSLTHMNVLLSETVTKEIGQPFGTLFLSEKVAAYWDVKKFSKCYSNA